MVTIISRVWATLAARVTQTPPRTRETGSDQGPSGLGPLGRPCLRFGLNPGVLASAGVAGGHGSIPAVALAVMVACMAVVGRPARRPRRRGAGRPAGLAGLHWVAVIVAAGALAWLCVHALPQTGAGVFG